MNVSTSRSVKMEVPASTRRDHMSATVQWSGPAKTVKMVRNYRNFPIKIMGLFNASI